MIKGILFVCLNLFFSLAFAQSDLVFDTPYIFDMLKGAPATGGFVTVKNPTTKDVWVEFVSADQFKVVENHQTVEKNGRMAMQRIKGFTVPAHGQFELKPGSYHIMFFEPQKDMVDGDKVKVFYKIDGKLNSVIFPIVSRMPEKNRQ